MKLGAIEAGGTKFVVCIGNEKGESLCVIIKSAVVIFLLWRVL